MSAHSVPEPKQLNIIFNKLKYMFKECVFAKCFKHEAQFRITI